MLKHGDCGMLCTTCDAMPVVWVDLERVGFVETNESLCQDCRMTKVDILVHQPVKDDQSARLVRKA